MINLNEFYEALTSSAVNEDTKGQWISKVELEIKRMQVLLDVLRSLNVKTDGQI